MSGWGWEWVDPTGVSYPLWVEYDVTGIFAPPAVIETDEVPGQAGARFRAARHGPREFPLPLYWYDEDPASLHQRLRDIVYAMEPTRGEGALRATSLAGGQRELNCRIIAGLDLAQTHGRQAMPTHQRATVMAQALQPYWTAVSDIGQSFTLGAAPAFFPIFPLRLAASEIAVDGTVVNGGDVETWPVWTLTGPGSGIVLRNLTTGKLLALSQLGGLVLGLGETAVIDTRPAAKSVTKNDGTNLWPYLNSASSLWPLARGGNSIRLEMASTSAASALSLSYRPRYLSP